MLLELSITDFAIIDQLRVRLDEHLNVFTGETGAGKSILVDAVSALIGARVGADAVRSATERALVEGVFDVSAQLAVGTADGRRQVALAAHGPSPQHNGRDTLDTESPGLADILYELGLEAEDGLLILTREISHSGRSLARVNGQAVPISALQRIASTLIDLHGQSAHLTLLRVDQHVYYLDRFANTVTLREQVADAVARWRAIRREIASLERDEREIERRVALLQFQVDEIAAARLQPGELDALERERRVLANAERLGLLANQVHAALAGEDGSDAPAVYELLSGARRALDELIRLDPRLTDQAAALDESFFKLEDVAASVRAYQDDVAADPARLAAVEERLDVLARLRRKYGATVEDILAYHEEAAAELEQLVHREERVAELKQRDEELRAHTGQLAARLSLLRRAAATELARAMERELDALSMKRARFMVDIQHELDPDGVPLPPEARLEASSDADSPPERYACGPSGVDRVEFLIAPNQGGPFKPLVRIASGGETSRLMLALRSILSSADEVPSLIFDEIDAGISGRVGQVVGEKLWRLGRSHQVICVTHLPQIAALGDAHYSVAKRLSQGRTTTQVTALTPDARVAELAQMLGGAPSAASRANAAELLQRGEQWKQGYAARMHA